MIDFEKFKNYLDSEEGQQAMDRMAEKWAEEFEKDKSKMDSEFKDFIVFGKSPSFNNEEL
jgi:hypothetical protein